ncbi:hypothetical protein KM043_005589 [Ampulex compressa]|nr:hypothetical protein KM043_005589 [Ampulex compressa]
MANPRKFSEKIALLNQKEAQETAAFEAIMREVSDVTSRVASASSSVGASPTGSGAPEIPLSVKSAGASPPQSSGKHLHINLGNQFRPGGSLPNVNNNANCGNDSKEQAIDLKSVETCCPRSPIAAVIKRRGLHTDEPLGKKHLVHNGRPKLAAQNIQRAMDRWKAAR